MRETEREGALIETHLAHKVICINAAKCLMLKREARQGSRAGLTERGGW